jgi:putative transposase
LADSIYHKSKEGPIFLKVILDKSDLVYIGREDIRARVKEIFSEVEEHHQFEIEEIRVAFDHVHIFLNFPPRYSIAHVVGMLKSVSASEAFEEFPALKEL